MDRRVRGSGTRYALVLEFDAARADRASAPGDRDLAEMEAFLAQCGFGRRRGPLYLGDATVDVVRCVIVIQDLVETFEWFASSVLDPRMLRIEAEDDLMPTIERVRPAPAVAPRRANRLDA